MSHVTRTIRRLFNTKALMEDQICYLAEEVADLSNKYHISQGDLNMERHLVDSILKEVVTRDETIANLRAELSESNTKLENLKSTVRELYTDLTYGSVDEKVTQPLDEDHWSVEHDVWACSTCYTRTYSDVPF